MANKQKQTTKQTKSTDAVIDENNATADLSAELAALGDGQPLDSGEVVEDVVSGAGEDAGEVGEEPAATVGEDAGVGEEPAVVAEAPVADTAVEEVAVIDNASVISEGVAAAAAELATAEEPVTDFATPVTPVVETTTDTSQVRVLKAYFDTYVEALAPGKSVELKTGGKYQVKLYRTINSAINLQYTEFKEVFDYLLTLVKEHRAAAFSDVYVRRFDHLLHPSMTKPEIHIYDQLLSVITTVGRSNDRSRALQQIDLGLAFRGVRPASAQQNLSAYFNAFKR